VIKLPKFRGHLKKLLILSVRCYSATDSNLLEQLVFSGTVLPVYFNAGTYE